jgi:hypothetical protein
MNMQKPSNLFHRFFHVYAEPQTWLNFLYLFLMFPLGLFYFIVLISGLSLGVGLFILWIGVLILAGIMLLSWGFIHLERLLAVNLLKADIPELGKPVRPDAPFLEKLKTYISNPALWKGIAYLFIKFPLGIIVFSIMSSLVGIGLGFVAGPFLLPMIQIQWLFWSLVSIPLGLIASAIGIILLTVILHLFNFISRLFKSFTEVMLGSKSSAR